MERSQQKGGLFGFLFPTPRPTSAPSMSPDLFSSPPSRLAPDRSVQPVTKTFSGSHDTQSATQQDTQNFQPEAPSPEKAKVISHIDTMLSDIYEKTRRLEDGALADYIPELATASPDGFGIAIATASGHLQSIGDAQTEFTIQSTSKALTYCLALELCGRQQVFSRVGVEPSGDPFNSIEFNPITRRPYNPMVNAGAIAVSGMLRDAVGADAAFDLIIDRFSQAAGRPLKLNDDVYRSEATTGHRNRAIGHLLLSAGALNEPVEPALDLYFKQCSIMVSATDLAMIGATLANLGVHPITGQQVFDIDAVRDTQAVMFTCGMYDYSGGWAFDVGIPAKSGVGGGILGIVNRQLGIGTYSPRLDPNGNSVRGVASFKMMSDGLGLHAFDLTNTGSAYVSTLFERQSQDVEV